MRLPVITLSLFAMSTLFVPPATAGDHLVEGTEDAQQNNVWKSNGSVSPPVAALGDPTNRLRIAVANGDTVTFRVTGARKHGVVFENAKKEIQNNVWSVKTTPNPLKDIDSTFKDFDPAQASTTGPVQSGDIIVITVSGLKPGDANGILFGCDPHSKKGNDQQHPKNRSMLGVIVLQGK
jgi:hypothetical protein